MILSAAFLKNFTIFGNFLIFLNQFQTQSWLRGRVGEKLFTLLYIEGAEAWLPAVSPHGDFDGGGVLLLIFVNDSQEDVIFNRVSSSGIGIGLMEDSG